MNINVSNQRPVAVPSSNRSRKRQICRYYKKGGCNKDSDNCDFAHGLHELRRPVGYKTLPCNYGNDCEYGPKDCNYMHTESQAAWQARRDAEEAERALQRLRKTQLCFYYDHGGCFYEDCNFAHGEAELVRHANYKTKLCEKAEKVTVLETMDEPNEHGNRVEECGILNRETLMSFQVAYTYKTTVSDKATAVAVERDSELWTKFEKCKKCERVVSSLKKSECGWLIIQECEACKDVPIVDIDREKVTTIEEIPEDWKVCRMCKKSSINSYKKSKQGFLNVQECPECKTVVTTVKHKKHYLSMEEHLKNGRDKLSSAELEAIPSDRRFDPDYVKNARMQPAYQAICIFNNKLAPGYFSYHAIYEKIANAKDCIFNLARHGPTKFISHASARDPPVQNCLTAEEEWRAHTRQIRGTLQGEECTIPVRQYHMVSSTLQAKDLKRTTITLVAIAEIDDYHDGSAIEFKFTDKKQGMANMYFKYRSSGIKTPLGNIDKTQYTFSDTDLDTPPDMLDFDELYNLSEEISPNRNPIYYGWMQLARRLLQMENIRLAEGGTRCVTFAGSSIRVEHHSTNTDYGLLPQFEVLCPTP